MTLNKFELETETEIKKNETPEIIQQQINWLYILAVWKAFCAPEMISLIGPREVANDGGGMLKKCGIGADLNGFNECNELTGTATGTGKIIGDFLRLFKIVAAFMIFAALIALAALKPAIFNAIVFLATRNGAVIRLNAASFVAFA